MDSSGPEAEWSTLPLPVGVRAPRTIRGSAGDLSGERRGLITPVVGLLYGLESRTFPFCAFPGKRDRTADRGAEAGRPRFGRTGEFGRTPPGPADAPPSPVNPPGGLESRGVMHRGSPYCVNAGNPDSLADVGSPDRSKVEVDGERGIKPLPAMVVVQVIWWIANADVERVEGEEDEEWLRNRFYHS